MGKVSNNYLYGFHEDFGTGKQVISRVINHRQERTEVQVLKTGKCVTVFGELFNFCDNVYEYKSENGTDKLLFAFEGYDNRGIVRGCTIDGEELELSINKLQPLRGIREAV